MELKVQLSGRKVSIFRLTLPLTSLFTPPLCFHTSTLHTQLQLRFHHLNHRFTLFINEHVHTLHRLFMAVLSRSFLTLWLLNSTFLPEERPPASISPPGRRPLFPETASAACRSRVRHPFLPALPCPLTCCSCSHDGPQTFYSGSCPPSPVVHPLWANVAWKTRRRERAGQCYQPRHTSLSFVLLSRHWLLHVACKVLVRCLKNLKVRLSRDL